MFGGDNILARLHLTQILLVSILLAFYLLYRSLHQSEETGIGRFKNRFQYTAQTLNASMSAGINAIRVPAKANHTASVIWLHGLGDTGQGWKFISRYYDFPVFPLSWMR